MARLVLAVVLVGAGVAHAQLTISKNGQFTNLVDPDGKIVFTVVRNGQFTNLVDQKGNLAYTLVQNGQFLNFVDPNGNVAFTATQNGPFLNLVPAVPEAPRRSEINRDFRRRAETEALNSRAETQQYQKQMAATAATGLDAFRAGRSQMLAIGFTPEELDRFERVLLKFEEANKALSKNPEPVRIITGIGESHVDFERRHDRWKQDVAPHVRMVELCREEMTKFMEKHKRLSGQ